MPRSAATDYLQTRAFWLMDVAPVEPLALPVFTPMLGFSSITSPELQAEPFEVTEGNWHFRRHVIKKASFTPMIIRRGVTLYDSDFWRWAVAGVTGDTTSVTEVEGRPIGQLGGITPRRDMVLIAFMTNTPFENPAIAASIVGAGGLAAGVGLSAISPRGAADAAVGATVGAAAPGPFEFAARIPAKAWFLKGCLPMRYKMGSDYDAEASEISIAELEMTVDHVEELALTA